ncbi:MAG TPA: hypothetical protein VFM18_16830 [Methanosarcina sp.]|nr:hypothetical protein [Methanosarcina sp.]
MTDAEKIEWFDRTMDWIDQWGSSAEARSAVDYSSDAAFDLFFDVVDQYAKDRGK